MSLADVAAGFANSQEFKNLYGASPTNAELVTRLYQNVLHRAPDSGGFQHWTGLLDSGQLAVKDVMVGVFGVVGEEGSSGGIDQRRDGIQPVVGLSVIARPAPKISDAL
ncbi:MAG TPA: DUF4214 domain-containing protein [Noviherbaspirillum sp.]|nr:DUF4214 domain-containing protein [Noviherbaspirillum sp.]